MTEPTLEARPEGSLDHRHRHRLLARRRARRALGRAQRQAHQRRRASGLRPTSCIRSTPVSARRPDPEEGRPAPDGSLAAHRHLCRRPGARSRRHQGQQGHPRSKMDMIVAAGGGERDLAVDVAILTADAKAQRHPAFLNERLMNDLAADAVPGAALQPARRQHRHRARRHAAPRAPSWARKPPASTRSRIALRASRRPERASRWSAAPTMASAPTCCVLYEFGDFNSEGQARAGLGARAARGLALGIGRRLPGAGIEDARGSARRQAPRPSRPSASPTSAAAQAARRRSRRAGAAVAERSPRGEAAALRSSRARPAPSPRRRGRARLPEGRTRTSPCARTGTDVRPYAWNRSSRSGLALAALSISRGALFPPNDPPGPRLKRPAAPDPDCGGGGRALARRRHGAGRGRRLSVRRDGAFAMAMQDHATNAERPDRRRHRHGHRDLARRRQGRQLGRADRRRVRHPHASRAFRSTA